MAFDACVAQGGRGRCCEGVPHLCGHGVQACEEFDGAQGGQRVGSTAEGHGKGNVAATMRVCTFGRGSVALSVALSVAVLVGVLAVVAVGVSVIFK